MGSVTFRGVRVFSLSLSPGSFVTDSRIYQSQNQSERVGRAAFQRRRRRSKYCAGPTPGGLRSAFRKDAHSARPRPSKDNRLYRKPRPAESGWSFGSRRMFSGNLRPCSVSTVETDSGYWSPDLSAIMEIRTVYRLYRIEM